MYFIEAKQLKKTRSQPATDIFHTVEYKAAIHKFPYVKESW